MIKLRYRQVLQLLDMIDEIIDKKEKAVNAYPAINKKEGIVTRDEKELEDWSITRDQMIAEIDSIEFSFGSGSSTPVPQGAVAAFNVAAERATEPVKSPGAIYEFEMGKSRKEEEVANITE